jgi:putative hydrolase of the HAD superfamily
MKKHVFFDLDHTLWDFEQNSEVCLRTIHQDSLKNQVDFSTFSSTFRRINKGLWRALEQNSISHYELRQRRFKEALEELGISCTVEASLAMNDEFMRLLPQQTLLMDGALDALNYLSQKFQLHIISNGYLDIQTRKMEGSGILRYFTHLITSDIAGSRKPDTKIFDFALDTAKASREDSVYIGDDEIADKEGAEKTGMPFIWYAPQHTEVNHKQISNLRQLLTLL